MEYYICLPEKLKKSLAGLKKGGIGIRTLGTREGTTVFKTAPINHSGIPPNFVVWILPILLKTFLIVKSKYIVLFYLQS